MNKPYTGIGSRTTPKSILPLLESVGEKLATLGFILRSGAAKGADSAFEKGALGAAGLTEIYLPWIGFNRHSSARYHLPETAISIAKQFHPAWWKLTAPARKLQARNSLQILGEALNPEEKSLFLLCYTEGGKIQGGTAQGIRLAVHYDIPIFNYGDYEHLPSTIVTEKADAFLSRFLPETLRSPRNWKLHMTARKVTA